LSAELYRLILEAKATEKLSRESILKSSAPTDKPLLIEGEQFCGLDEGFTGYSLENNYSFIEHAFTAFINFENTHYKEKWTDNFHFIKETDGWKLHDIVYGTKKSPKSLKQVLVEFILAGKAEQKQLQKQLKK
jgi:succinate dehydrogenase flavin-adding protein (antitoxin of CptAB toxin-antitoxin module)